MALKYGMKQGKANRVLPRERTGHSKHPLPTTRDDFTHGRHQMVNTEIRLIIFFAAEDGEDLYCQQKQDLELPMAQTISSVLQTSEVAHSCPTLCDPMDCSPLGPSIHGIF